MRSAAVAVIAGAVILVAAIAVVIRLQSPHKIGSGTHPLQPPRASRVVGGTDRQQDTVARSEPMQERLTQLREDHAERRRLRLPTRPELQAPEGVVRGGRRERKLEDAATPEETGVAALENTLLNDPDPEERAGAAFLLSTNDEDENAYRALLRGLSDPDAEVRLSVVEALEDFDERLTVDALAPAVNDPDPEVRFEVVSLLGDMETPEALAAVQALVQDPDEDVRTLAEGIVELAE
jgi:hypothetical protein